MTDETKFEVGDVVEWCGVRGEVTATDRLGEFCVSVDFQGPEAQYIERYMKERRFMSDGKAECWHKEPSLKLIKRKPFRWEGEVTWKDYEINELCTLIYPTTDTLSLPKEWQEFAGKRGRLTFEEIIE